MNQSMANLIWIMVLSMLAGIGKGTANTIAHHFYKSIFANIKSEFWLKWFQSSWLDRPNHPIWFLWDGWHFFDTLSYFVYLPLCLLVTDWLQLIEIVAFRWLMFHLLYNYLLISDKEYDNKAQ